jgi:hypothetical protein
MWQPHRTPTRLHLMLAHELSKLVSGPKLTRLERHLGPKAQCSQCVVVFR